MSTTRPPARPAAPAVVAIGGGHGLSRALQALRLLDVAPTAVVTPADDGGSSGRLRADQGTIAPGDLRMALHALADNRLLAESLQYRFQRGDLAGHAVGNLLLVALAESAGDWVSGLDRAGQLLGCQGRVLPSTSTPVQLRALVDGRQIDGQVRVAGAGGRIERVWLEPAHPPACIEAVAAIEAADLVLLGPGSLYTSIIANLAVPGVGAALRRTSARIVYIGNILTQPGETDGLSARDHVQALRRALRDRTLDAVVLHDGPAGLGPGEPIDVPDHLDGVREILYADLTARTADGRLAGGHGAGRLADALRQPLAAVASSAGRRGAA